MNDNVRNISHAAGSTVSDTYRIAGIASDLFAGWIDTCKRIS